MSLSFSVTAATLVVHVRGDARVPFDAGRQMASGIPGARFIALQGQNTFFWSMSRRPTAFLKS